jgi:hypothetical protein
VIDILEFETFLATMGYPTGKITRTCTCMSKILFPRADIGNPMSRIFCTWPLRYSSQHLWLPYLHVWWYTKHAWWVLKPEATCASSLSVLPSASYLAHIVVTLKHNRTHPCPVHYIWCTSNMSNATATLLICLFRSLFEFVFFQTFDGLS